MLTSVEQYSVGYAGYYGLSLIIGSQTVLFVSLCAHMCQFAFLLWFENPRKRHLIAKRMPDPLSIDIARTYGKPKPLASRTPLLPPTSIADLTRHDAPASDTAVGSTAAQQPYVHSEGWRNVTPESLDNLASRSRPTTQHDLNNRYFLNELVITKNFDIFRSRDFGFAVAFFYSICFICLPLSTGRQRLVFASVNAVFWRLFHSAGLGMVLYKQSTEKWLVRHFLKHYFYEQKESFGPVQDAFRNWAGLYNFSLGMTYVSFVCLAWNCYALPSGWTFASVAMRHTFGLLLIALHCWTARETFEVLGSAGWFYADFFVCLSVQAASETHLSSIQLEEYPKTLYYTGIYRFLNVAYIPLDSFIPLIYIILQNPERIMGGAAFFGMTLISGSKLVASLAIVSVLGQ